MLFSKEESKNVVYENERFEFYYFKKGRNVYK